MKKTNVQTQAKIVIWSVLFVTIGALALAVHSNVSTPIEIIN